MCTCGYCPEKQFCQENTSKHLHVVVSDDRQKHLYINYVSDKEDLLILDMFWLMLFLFTRRVTFWLNVE